MKAELFELLVILLHIYYVLCHCIIKLVTGNVPYFSYIIQSLTENFHLISEHIEFARSEYHPSRLGNISSMRFIRVPNRIFSASRMFL